MHLPWHPVQLAPGGPPVSTSITDAEAAELGRLAEGVRVLEVGSAFGFSACAMALAGAESVTAVDPHQQLASLGTMMENLGGYGVSGKVEVVTEISQTALPMLVAIGARFGLVFVDGDHSEAGAGFDIDMALKLLDPGGVLAVHDYHETCCCPEVRLAVDRRFPGAAGAAVTDTLFVVTP
jgi:protein-L-isoaspartate O-methyltransferase